MLQMYPHPVDRCRIGVILLKDAIREHAVHEIARRADVSATTIYNLIDVDYVTERANDNKDAATRQALLKILGWGLKLYAEDIDVFLWLYVWNKKGDNKEGFQPVDEDDCIRYQIRRRERPLPYTDTEPRRDHAVDLLAKACNRSDGSAHGEIRMMLARTETERLKSAEDLLEFENQVGHTMAVIKYPIHLTWPEDLVNSDEFHYQEITSDTGKRRASVIRIQRWHKWRANVETYGVREIISQWGLARYLTVDMPHRLDFEQRKTHVRNLISLLNDPKNNYEIAFADAELDTEIWIRSTAAAVTRGAPGGSQVLDKRIACGPAYVYCDKPTPVLSFLVSFEREWKKACEEAATHSKPNKDYVIQILECLITLAENLADKNARMLMRALKPGLLQK